MKKNALLILLIGISFILNGQVTFESKNALVSSTAFNKKIATDFNYLILGDNSPQQGISATLNEKKSNIKINGLLYSGVSGVLTLEADLAASNGIYFFDQSNGSEKGKITFNYYKRLTSLSTFKSLNIKDRAYINLQIVDLMGKVKTKFDSLSKLLSIVKFNDTIAISQKEKDKVEKTLREISRKYGLATKNWTIS